MALLFNGNEPKNIIYNGNDVSEVIFNEVVVWEKQSSIPMDMVAWWKAETINLPNNSLVSEWVDSSSNNYNATANGNIYYKTIGEINMPCVSLPIGSNFSTTLLSYKTPRTIFTVANFNFETNKSYSIISANNTRGIWLGAENNTRKIQGGVIGVKAFFESENRTSTSETAVRTYAFETGHQEGYLNGVLEDTGTSSDYGNTSRILQIGGNTYQDYAGEIYEIIIYDRVLSNEELYSVNTYLLNKYGIS